MDRKVITGTRSHHNRSRMSFDRTTFDSAVGGNISFRNFDTNLQKTHGVATHKTINLNTRRR